MTEEEKNYLKKFILLKKYIPSDGVMYRVFIFETPTVLNFIFTVSKLQLASSSFEFFLHDLNKCFTFLSIQSIVFLFLLKGGWFFNLTFGIKKCYLLVQRQILKKKKTEQKYTHTSERYIFVCASENCNELSIFIHTRAADPLLWLILSV